MRKNSASITIDENGDWLRQLSDDVFGRFGWMTGDEVDITVLEGTMVIRNHAFEDRRIVFSRLGESEIDVDINDL